MSLLMIFDTLLYQIGAHEILRKCFYRTQFHYRGWRSLLQCCLGGTTTQHRRSFDHRFYCAYNGRNDSRVGEKSNSSNKRHRQLETMPTWLCTLFALNSQSPGFLNHRNRWFHSAHVIFYKFCQNCLHYLSLARHNFNMHSWQDSNFKSRSHLVLYLPCM